MGTFPACISRALPGHIKDVCEQPCVCWQFHLAALKELPELLTTEPLLQLHCLCFCNGIWTCGLLLLVLTWTGKFRVWGDMVEIGLEIENNLDEINSSEQRGMDWRRTRTSITMAGSCVEDGIMLPFSPFLESYVLSGPSSILFPDPWRD